MTAQIRRLGQDNILDIIKEISELAKNPKNISMLHDSIIKQKELTDLELKKLEEAREFIKKYDSLKNKVDDSSELLEKEQQKHLNNIAAFNSYCNEERLSLKKDKEDLSIKQKTYENNVAEFNRLNSEFNRLNSELETKIKKYDDDVDNYLEEVKVREEKIIQKHKEVMSKQDALDKKEAKLKSYLEG